MSKLWDLRATAMIKNEDNLKQNMHSMYVVVMSLCDANRKDKVKAHNYAEIKHTRDTLKLLQVINQYMYSNGSDNQVMSITNLFWMIQEKGQPIQSFRDQFAVMSQVCEQLGLTIGQSEQGARAVLKKRCDRRDNRAIETGKGKGGRGIFLHTVHVHGQSTKIWKSGRRFGK